MLSGEGNAGQRWKITIGLISEKATLHVQHTLFLYISLPLFCTTTTLNFQNLLSYTFFSVTFFHCSSIFLLYIPNLWTINVSLKLLKTRIQRQFPLSIFLFIAFLVVSAFQDAGGYAISRQNNLELHLGCHTCWLNYFTLVCLWCGRTVSRAVCAPLLICFFFLLLFYTFISRHFLCKALVNFLQVEMIVLSNAMNRSWIWHASSLSWCVSFPRNPLPTSLF